MEVPAFCKRDALENAEILDIPIHMQASQTDGKMTMMARSEDAGLVNRLFENMGMEKPMVEGKAPPAQQRLAEIEQPAKTMPEKDAGEKGGRSSVKVAFGKAKADAAAAGKSPMVAAHKAAAAKPAKSAARYNQDRDGGAMIMDKYYSEPTDSPWGKVQHCEQIHPGMFQVDTASHGGIMVHRSVVPDLSPAAQMVGDPNPPFLCYEEDCDAAVVFRELLDIPEWKIPSSYLNTRANFEAAIDRSLEAWHKDYLASRDPSHPTLQQHLKKMGLPESCYCILPSTQEVIIVQRGESGYTRAVCSSGDASMNRQIVDRENQTLGVSPAQEEAMRVGSMFGWTVPGANPQNYAEDGTLKKPKRKSQPER